MENQIQIKYNDIDYPMEVMVENVGSSDPHIQYHEQRIESLSHAYNDHQIEGHRG